MSYWTDRVDDLKKWIEKNEEKTKKRLSSYYDKEWSRLDKEIASYYAKYGTDNVIEYRNMMQKLSDDDIKLLMEKMDDFAEKYPQYAHLMPVRESIYQLNRLEGLQYSITLQQLEMGAITNEEVTDYLDDLAVKGLNMSAEVMGFGKNFYSVNSDIVKQFVNTAWCNGENFSQRIWGNSEKLANYLRNDVAQGFARGDSYEKLTKELRRRFSNVSRNDAYRVIYTEGTYVMAESSMQPFTDDFEQYRILTAEDSKVCPVCRAMAEKVFNISERQAGTNFPPFHPWCRCTFEIAVDDWDAWMDKYVEKHSGEAKNGEKISSRIKNEMPKFETKDIADVKSFKAYTEEEIDDMLLRHEQILDDLPIKKSKWSGKIEYDDSNDMRKQYGKLWSCNIRTSHTTCPHILLHEQLHARSISYYGKDIYKIFKNSEEIAVQFLTQEISVKKGIEIVEGGYEPYIDKLRYLNKKLNLFESDYDFALELFKQPPANRRAWLEEKVYNVAIQYDIETLEKTMDILEETGMEL